MATLQQTLRGLPQADEQLVRGPGGTLQRTKKLQQAVKDTGVATAPTTPMGAQMIGADAQASKMAGTPQQMQATLQTALRQKQYGREATEQEAGAIAKSADMQKLGGLGGRVQSMIDSEAEKLKKATATAGVVPKFGEEELTPEVISKLQELQNTSPGSEDYNQLIIDINTALGKTLQTALGAEQLLSLYQTSAQAIGDVAAKTIINPEDIRVADLLPELGYTAEDLAGLLNVPITSIQEYTVEDLQNKINQVSSEEFTRTQQLEQQATSPYVGIAQRGLARETARELSAVGIRATEADMQRLEESIARADMISFPPGTPKRPIAEALADDEISAMIKEIVESPKGSQLRIDIENQAPDFYKFITDNETILKEASDKLETGVTQFKQLQETNLETLNKLKIDSSLLSQIAPEVTGFQTKLIDITEVPVLNYLNTIPEIDRQEISEIINTAVVNRYITPDDLNKLTLQEYQDLEIGKLDSNWSRFLDVQEHRKQFQNIASPKGQLEYISGTKLTVPQIEAAINDVNNIKNLGLPISTIDLSAYDVDKNGTPDWDKLNEVYNKLNPPQSLKSAAKSVTPAKISPISFPSVSAQMLANNYLTTEQARKLNQMFQDPNTKISIDPRITAILEAKEKTPQRINNEIINKPLNNPKAISEYSKRFAELYKEGNHIDKEAVKRAVTNWVTRDLFTKHYTETRWDGGHLSNIYKDLKTSNLLVPETEKILRNKLIQAYGPKYGDFLDSITVENPTGDQSIIVTVPTSRSTSDNKAPTFTEAIQGIPEQIGKETTKIITSALAPALKTVSSVAAPIAKTTEKILTNTSKAAEKAITGGQKKGEATIRNIKKGRFKW